jgi:hypothetical protein
MPVGEWQFWVVTLAAIGGVMVLARVVMPRKPRGKKTSLTVSAGKRA